MAGVPLNEEDAAVYYRELYHREKEEREVTERKLFWKRYAPKDGEGDAFFSAVEPAVPMPRGTASLDRVPDRRCKSLDSI